MNDFVLYIALIYWYNYATKMDSLYKNGRVRSYILIFLIFASFVISVPLKKRISSGVNYKIESFAKSFYKQTGLNITYENLSPSILSNFYVKKIRIVDDENTEIITIEKTKVSYNILKLLRNDIQSGISSVLIDGIKLDVNEVLDIVNRFKKQSSSSNFDIKNFRDYVPENVKLKNVSIVYDDKNLSGQLRLKTISINNNINKENLDFKIDAQANVFVPALKKDLAGKVGISGNFDDTFEKSLMNIKFENITDGTYKLNKLSLLVQYAKNTLEVHTVQVVNPVNIGFDYHFDTKDVNIQINAENFKPLSLFTVTSKQKELQKIQNLKLTTDTIVKFNLNDKTLDYITDTNAYIPDALVKGGLNTVVAAYGNQDKCEVTGLKLNGERYNVSGKLQYVYNTFQLSGLLEMPSVMLNNGNVISTELYIDPLDKGFMVFAPQIFVGQKAFTALQLSMIPHSDSFDFNFEVSDYSHIEEMDPGMLKIDGSYLTKSKYVQSNITLTSIYLDSIAELAGQLVKEELKGQIDKIQEKLSPYVFSGDVYASTDFKSLSYNVPYVLLANSKKENQLVMFSMNGSDQNFQLNQLSLIAGKYTMEMAATIDRNPDTSDLFFTLDVNNGAIPYHFTGTVMPEVCTVSGDYGTDFEIHFNKNESYDGHVLLKSFPIKIGDSSIILSTDSAFTYNKEEGPSVQVNHFELEGTDSNTSVNPRFVFSGNATKYGAQLNSVSYTDLYSALQGTADLMLNINGDVFDSVGLMADLKNPLTEETVTLDCNVTNPDHLPFNIENFKNSYYLNIQVLAKDLGLNRFAISKNANNLITGSLNAFGTVEHPYISVNIDDFNYLLSTSFIRGNGTVLLEDRDITVDDLDIYFGNYKFENINAKASLIDMTLEATGQLDSIIMHKSVKAPLKLTVGNAIVPEGKFLPDSISATISTTAFSGGLIKKEFPLSISTIYSDKTFSIYSGNNELNGMYSTDGLLQLSVDNRQFLKFNLDGLINKNTCNLDLYDVDVDLGLLANYIDIDSFIMIQKGNLSGEVVVTGKINDPDFTGAALISSGEAVLPWLTKQKLKVDDMNFLFNHNEIVMQDTPISIKSGERVNITFGFYMNKWELETIEGSVKNIGKDLFPVKMVVPVLTLSGDVSVDLKIFKDKEHVEVTGNCFGENVNLKSSLTALAASTQSMEPSELRTIPFYADINVTLGTHASIDFDPVLRCVFVPNTKMNIKYDQANSLIGIDGELKLKSGDIAYLNRNFYIKSGNIDFSHSTVDNPLITINAETREKDSNGQNVKIIMDVVNQPLQNFEPRFTAIPAKSENEIRTMLGQIAVADSSNAANFLFAASDYAIQSTVVRQAENKLRDLCNFDIFSVRTNVLQNTLNMGVSGELSKKNLSIGNFLDNTTVYIGKYLGSSLYLDAMLHVTFEDNVDIGDITTPGKVLFQPEFGMEFESPFANIRVNMAPDINALMNNQFVPSTSVTLSWKITY